MIFNADTKIGTIDVVKNSIITLCEPPLDLDIKADFVIIVCYKVVDEEQFNHVGDMFPKDVISDSVAIDVFRAVNSVYPKGLSCTDIAKPSDSIGQVAFDSVDKEAFMYCGIVISGISLKEIRVDDSVFAGLGPIGAMLKSKLGDGQQSDKWTCFVCSSVNSSKFCPNCGNPRN